jgi:hypothetical protein
MTTHTPTEAWAPLNRLDQLLTRALILAADRWDDTAALIAHAHAIARVLAAEHDAPPIEVPGLAELDLPGCVAVALREAQGWVVVRAGSLADLTKLRVLLADVHRALAAETHGQA